MSETDLQIYRRKRDPEKTPEPFGRRLSVEARLFVVQKHAARRLHYDLRLEAGGVLKSWAVPKGPSLRAGEKRLAVHVEDHPVEYAGFEGVIPPGNYGAGNVIVWDRGWYAPLGGEDIAAQIERGKVEFELFGYKLRGAWVLARMSNKDKEWLLLKKADGYASKTEITQRYPHSILSGLIVEELGDVPEKVASLRERLEALGAPQRALGEKDRRLMHATLKEGAFSSPDWLFEIKHDGVRVLAARDGGGVQLYGRDGKTITRRYPEIASAVRALAVENLMIDGEIVALDEQGRPSFQQLQPRIGLSDPAQIERQAYAAPLTGVFFDCLSLEGFDIRGLPLVMRKDLLAGILPAVGPIHYLDHVVEQGETFFAAVCERGLEGVVGKRNESRYAGARSRDWIKIKCQRRQEFVIGGYTDPQGGRSHFGALHLGLYEGDSLVYVSKVGTGFDARALASVWRKLQPLRRVKSPFERNSPAGRVHHWVEPKLVCEVRFSEWTADGGIRHPAFLGLREDKPARECRREAPPAMIVAPPPAPAADPRQVRLSNLKKVFWPAEGYTKKDLIEYYRAVSRWLIPYLKDRPLVLVRYPDGIEGKSFFQKDAPDFIPDWVRTERIYSKDTDRDIRYFVVDDEETLTYLVNLGTIPIHLWSSRLGSLQHPDWIVLDLDPKGAPFDHVVKVARVLHRILTEIRVPNYLKTSGASGLHILIPLGARYTYDEARAFSRLLSMLGAEELHEIATISRPIHTRGGKVYIDFGQNGYGQTIAAPFSVRPLPGAPVSCPLRWEEANRRLDPRRFTIATVPTRFRKIRDPLSALLRQSVDLAAALKRVEKRLGGV